MESDQSERLVQDIASVEPEPSGGRTLLVWVGLVVAIAALHGALRPPGVETSKAELEYLRPAAIRRQADAGFASGGQERKICQEVYRLSAGTPGGTLQAEQLRAVSACRDLGWYRP